MTGEIGVLIITAASIGLFHTLLGPDHYLPFVMMSKARAWTLPRTVTVTLACGIGHVLSSVVIGLIGIAAGVAVGRLEALEAFRGNLAAWALIGFGLAYAVWGFRHSLLRKGHAHSHLAGNLAGLTHVHHHDPSHVHSHPESGKPSLTPWVLFTIFVLGPCEPLIPILMYPAAQSSVPGMLLVIAAFGIATLATMTAVVVLLSSGYQALPLGRLERHSHAIAGLTIAISGLAIQVLGL